MVIGFGWGAVTVQYRVFPFHLIRGGVTATPAEKPEVGIQRAFDRHAAIAFVGDSLVANAPLTEMFPKLDILNRGVRGDTAERIARRIDTVHASRILLMFGIIDLHADPDPDGVAVRYAQVAADLAATGAR